jgi:uncharacterized MAPEG superfamily protein
MDSLLIHRVLIASIIAAAVAVYVPFFWVAYGRTQLGWQALATPRAMVDKLPAYAQRATWAHQNAFEAFVLYAAAALMAYITGAEEIWVMGAAIAHPIARLLYPMFYIANIPVGRSLMFGIGSLSTALLMGASIKQLL